MRVLLDEMLDRRLKRFLPEGVEAVTVRERGWDSKKNGELLTLAEKEFDVLLTTDRGIPHQQDLSRFDLEVEVISARSNRLADLEPRMEDVRRMIENLVRIFDEPVWKTAPAFRWGKASRRPVHRSRCPTFRTAARRLSGMVGRTCCDCRLR